MKNTRSSSQPLDEPAADRRGDEAARPSRNASIAALTEPAAAPAAAAVLLLPSLALAVSLSARVRSVLRGVYALYSTELATPRSHGRAL